MLVIWILGIGEVRSSLTQWPECSDLTPYIDTYICLPTGAARAAQNYNDVVYGKNPPGRPIRLQRAPRLQMVRVTHARTQLGNTMIWVQIPYGGLEVCTKDDENPTR